MTCYINGVEYKLTRDFSINDRLANKSASRIEVLVDGQPIPQAGDIVEILDGTRPLFYGVAGIPVSPEYSTGNEKRIYSITCQNGNAILANRITNEAYQNTTVSDIVTDLYNKYIAAEGFGLGFITASDVTPEVYTAVNTNLQSTLNELAALIGGAWTVTADQKFYFRQRDEFPVYADQVSRYHFNEMRRLKETTKSYKLRTVEHIIGATDTTSSQTESFIYTGDGDTFSLGFPVASQPSVKVNGVDISSTMGVAGLDDSNPNKYFFFSYNSAVISYRYSGLTPPLSAGDTVTFVYKGIFQIRVTARNDAKIDELANRYGTSGLIERVDTSNARTQRDAQSAADAYLMEYSEITHELTFRVMSDSLTDLDDLQIMHVVDVALPDFAIEGLYVVTERTITPARADMTGPDAWARMEIAYVMMDRDYLSGYGTVLSGLQNDVASLTIRSEDIAINQLNTSETRNRTEEMGITEDFPMWPIGLAGLQYITWPGLLNGTEGLEMYAGI